jgi:MoaA/NifB/PqqE/SkfB family radical SAM enzyme
MGNISTIFIGKQCNNDCIMCSVEKFGGYNVSYNDIYKKIKENREHKNSISFTGGETTEHFDIIKIIKTAKQFGYNDISVDTNGRNFSDKNFLEKMIEAGLDGVFAAIHGPKEIHNKITQKNSFN